jgi:hypothetical protein
MCIAFKQATPLDWCPWWHCCCIDNFYEHYRELTTPERLALCTCHFSSCMLTVWLQPCTVAEGKITWSSTVINQSLHSLLPPD